MEDSLKAEIQEKQIFFTNIENVNLFRQYKLQLENKAIKQTDYVKSVNKAICGIVDFLLLNAQRVDDFCVFNIDRHGHFLIARIRSFIQQPASYTPDLNAMIELFIPIYAIFKEFELYTNTQHPTIDGIELIEFVLNGDWKASKDLTSSLSYVLYQMPADILMNRLSHPNLKSVEQFDEILAKAEALKSQWDDELKIREEKLERIQKLLEDQKTASHFVALDQGFSNLERDKKISSWFALLILWAIALVILGVLVTQAAFIWDVIQNNQHYLNQKDNGIIPLFMHQVDLNQYAYLILPTLAIEVILIYFFRVVLSNYHSLKAQILQIELRRSLCQFIQSYADYAKEINDKSAGTLERFEQIIFSGIASDPDKVTTFDGVESLANVVKAIRG